MAELSRKHFFRDEHDNRTVVVTEPHRNGFKAYVLEGEGDDVVAIGFGDTRMAAIADLNNSIAMSRAEA